MPTLRQCWPLIYLALIGVQITAKPYHLFRSRQASNENVLAIRPLICINKLTNQSGVCMFTLDCMALNGTSLGVCGDKIFFGSCCVIPPATESTSNDPMSTAPTETISVTVSSTPIPSTEIPVSESSNLPDDQAEVTSDPIVNEQDQATSISDESDPTVSVTSQEPFTEQDSSQDSDLTTTASVESDSPVAEADLALPVFVPETDQSDNQIITESSSSDQSLTTDSSSLDADVELTESTVPL